MEKFKESKRQFPQDKEEPDTESVKATDQLQQTKIKLDDTKKVPNQELQRLTSDCEHEKSLGQLQRGVCNRIEELQENVSYFNHSTEKLEKDKKDLTKETEVLQKELDLAKTVLEQTKHDKVVLKSELKQCQLDFAKELRALKEVLSHSNQAKFEMQKVMLQKE